MREILFRAKSEDNYPYSSRWEYGIPFKDSYGNYVMKTTYGLVDVKKDTVGEFTGLTDKNDVKVFEGDIFEYELGDGRKKTYVVEWSYCYLGLVAKEIESKPLDWVRTRIDLLTRSALAVIGNVYDNPELLKGNDDTAD